MLGTQNTTWGLNNLDFVRTGVVYLKMFSESWYTFSFEKYVSTKCFNRKEFEKTLKEIFVTQIEIISSSQYQG